jgi:integrase/recombinase XerC
MTQQPLAAGVARYLASLRQERQLSPHTASSYGSDLAALVEYCETQGLTAWAEVDAQHVRMFAAREHRRGLAPRSIQRRLSACRGLFRFLLQEENAGLRRDPAADIRAPKASKRLPKPLDTDTMARLLEFRTDDRLGIRDKAIMELLYSSGICLAARCSCSARVARSGSFRSVVTPRTRCDAGSRNAP